MAVTAQGLDRHFDARTGSLCLSQLTVSPSILLQALAAMASGDLPRLGQLMCEAQADFDARAGPLCPSQLNAPVLHKALTWPAVQDLTWGCKGVGSQGDGTAQFLCKGLHEQQQVGGYQRTSDCNQELP